MVLSGVWRFSTPMALPGHLKYLGFHKPLSSGTTEMAFEAKNGEIPLNPLDLMKSALKTTVSSLLRPSAVPTLARRKKAYDFLCLS